jgi:hypothetical protein
MHMLELGPLDTLRGQDKVNLEQWVRKHYSDPRSKNKVKLNDMLPGYYGHRIPVLFCC